MCLLSSLTFRMERERAGLYLYACIPVGEGDPRDAVAYDDAQVCKRV